MSGEVGYLPQDLTLAVEPPVSAFLGVAPVLRAIRAIESGAVDPVHFEVIGDDWDIEDRAGSELSRLGLPADILDR